MEYGMLHILPAQLQYYELHILSLIDVVLLSVFGPIFTFALTALKLALIKLSIHKSVKEKSMTLIETVQQSHTLQERVTELEQEHSRLKAIHEADSKAFPLLVLIYDIFS
jgi:biopolymer transport protein ExbD